MNKCKRCNGDCKCNINLKDSKETTVVETDYLREYAKNANVVRTMSEKTKKYINPLNLICSPEYYNVTVSPSDETHEEKIDITIMGLKMHAPHINTLSKKNRSMILSLGEVLFSLFAGTRFNYILHCMNEEQNPQYVISGLAGIDFKARVSVLYTFLTNKNDPYEKDLERNINLLYTVFALHGNWNEKNLRYIINHIIDNHEESIRSDESINDFVSKLCENAEHMLSYRVK